MKILPAAQAILSVVMVGAVKTWAPVCSGMIDLVNGNQTHMKCWFSAQAVVCIAILTAAMAFVSMVMKESSDAKKLQTVIIAACVLMILIFTSLIGICAKAEMSCHVTGLWVKTISLIIAALGFANLISRS